LIQITAFAANHSTRIERARNIRRREKSAREGPELQSGEPRESGTGYQCGFSMAAIDIEL
jgi:hypothetical protein